MVQIVLARETAAFTLEVSGHADAVRGKDPFDLVCAAVSALAQGFALTLAEFVPSGHIRLKKKKGFFF